MEKKLAKLVEMQELCLKVEEDSAKMRAFVAFLLEAEERKNKLADFYQDEWLAFYEDEKNIEALREGVDKHVPEDHYNILDEDTIWDALVQNRIEVLTVLKTIVPMID